MRAFLTKIIPSKIEPDIICRVIKEIWINNEHQDIITLLATLDKPLTPVNELKKEL